MWAEWRGAHAGVTGPSRETHGGRRRCAGSVTEVRRTAEVRPLPNGQESPRFLTSPWPKFRTTQDPGRSRICQRLRGSEWSYGDHFEPHRSLRGSKSPSGVDFEPRKSLRGWKPPYGEGFQPRRSLTGRIPRNPSPLPHQAITEVRLPHEPVPDVSRTPHVLGVSWRSQPERTAMRRPGRTSDGRSGRPRPGKLSPDRHRHDGRRSVMGRALGGSRC
jgi:hypothetical protein